jgi:uncharacterized protein YggT (Ycf19 family)
LAALIVIVLRLMVYVIIADAILSWFQKPEQSPSRQLRALTAPLYQPVRAVIDPQKTGGLDLSPLIWLIALNWLIAWLH